MMIPLNDDWLSWPPESVDIFYTADVEYSLAVSARHDLELVDKQSQEVCHEKP